MKQWRWFFIAIGIGVLIMVAFNLVSSKIAHGEAAVIPEVKTKTVYTEKPCPVPEATSSPYENETVTPELEEAKVFTKNPPNVQTVNESKQVVSMDPIPIIPPIIENSKVLWNY